jgi:hypothetical protein
LRDIERITELLRQRLRAVVIRQLKVSHPGADDDGLWFLRQPETRFEVQIESSTGMCPFLIETDETDERFTADSVEGAVRILAVLLHLPERA